MRRPRPPKTRKAVTKRFKITASGKLMRTRSGKRHLLQHKSPRRRRTLNSPAEVSPTDAFRIRQSLPFGQ